MHLKGITLTGSLLKYQQHFEPYILVNTRSTNFVQHINKREKKKIAKAPKCHVLITFLFLHTLGLCRGSAFGIDSALAGSSLLPIYIAITRLIGRCRCLIAGRNFREFSNKARPISPRQLLQRDSLGSRSSPPGNDSLAPGDESARRSTLSLRTRPGVPTSSPASPRGALSSLSMAPLSSSCYHPFPSTTSLPLI